MHAIERSILSRNLGFGLLWDGELPAAATALLTGEKACTDIAGATCSTLTVPLDRTAKTAGDLDLKVVTAGEKSKRSSSS